MGFGASVTRFVAANLVKKDFQKILRIIETSIFSTSLASLFFIILAYYPLKFLLIKTFNEENAALALSLLPYSLISVWFSIISTVLIGVLDGLQRMFIKAVVIISSQILMLSIVFLLTPKLGLNALGLAQIFQGVISIIISWMYVKKVLAYKIYIPFHLHKSIFKELFNYGFNVQIGSVVMLMFDPLTKILFAKFGGASSAGLFEIASQIIIRCRTFIITANQVVVPKIATVFEESPGNLKKLYKKNIIFLIPVSITLYLSLFVWSNLIAQIIFVQKNENFDLIFYTLIFSWSINTLSAPAYFFNLGVGDAKKNASIHIYMAFINIVLGPFLGFFVGWKGVLLAHQVSLILASIMTIYKFHLDHGINMKFLGVKKIKNIFIFNFILLVLFIFIKFLVYRGSFSHLYIFEIFATLLLLYVNISDEILFETKKFLHFNFNK